MYTYELVIKHDSNGQIDRYNFSDSAEKALTEIPELIKSADKRSKQKNVAVGRWTN